MVKKSGLGRGLNVLIPENAGIENPQDHYEEIPVALLDPNPEQPRHTFHEDQLKELADSIKHNGVIQPIIVTPRAGRFVVIAGERRWRATKLAGYMKIPAVVRKVEEGQMLSLALLENIQRQELNPIEEALAYRKLLKTNDFTHETLASKLGKSRVTISNTIRLLKLPDHIKNMIEDNKLTFGHARCLVTIEDPERVMKLADSCLEKQWSVRELEKKIQQIRAAKKSPLKDEKLPLLEQCESKISRRLERKVFISGNGKKGKISIPYKSEQDLQAIVQILSNQIAIGAEENGG